MDNSNIDKICKHLPFLYTADSFPGDVISAAQFILFYVSEGCCDRDTMVFIGGMFDLFVLKKGIIEPGNEPCNSIMTREFKSKYMSARRMMTRGTADQRSLIADIEKSSREPVQKLGNFVHHAIKVPIQGQDLTKEFKQMCGGDVDCKAVVDWIDRTWPYFDSAHTENCGCGNTIANIRNAKSIDEMNDYEIMSLCGLRIED